MNIIVFILGVWDYSYTFAIDCVYDNNIFAYSQNYIEDFLAQTRPERFPFETYDDLITASRLNLLIRNRFFGKRTTTFNIGVALNHYLINQQKDFQKLDIGLRQSFGKSAVKLSYRLIPEYLIRYYKNPRSQNTEYIGCSVNYQTISVKFSLFHFSPLLFHLTYRLKSDDYTTEFDRYDAVIHSGKVNMEFKLSRRFSLSSAYEFKVSKTDSGSNSGTGTDPVPDGDYQSQTAGMGFDLEKKLVLPAELSIYYKYNFMNFSSGSILDSLHYSRQDHIHLLVFAVKFRLSPGLRLGISYTRRIRKATSLLFSEIDRIKNYDKYRIKTGIEFYY